MELDPVTKGIVQGGISVYLGIEEGRTDSDCWVFINKHNCDGTKKEIVAVVGC